MRYRSGSGSDTETDCGSGLPGVGVEAEVGDSKEVTEDSNEDTEGSSQDLGVHLDPVLV